MVRSPNRFSDGPLLGFRLVPLIAGQLAQRGIAAADLVRAAGLPLDSLRGEITAPLGRVVRFIDAAAVALDADLFGFELAHAQPSGAYGIPEFLARSAPDVRTALEAICAAIALVNPLLRFRFRADRDAGRLHVSIDGERDALGRHLNEYTIAVIVRQFGVVLDGPLPLLEVWFAHARPSGGEELARRIGASVRFQAGDCGFAVSNATLARAPRTADPVLFGFLTEQARTQLARFGPDDIVSQVARIVEVRLAHGPVDAPAIAAAMATTVRSLQRHLTASGTTFRRVLAHVRARRLEELRRGGADEAVIARELGFRTPAAMRRALAAE